MKRIVSSLVASIALVSTLNAADFYASVDGENITKKDITMVLQDPRIDFDKLPDTAKKQVLEQIINRKLLSKKALDDGTYILQGTYKTTYWTKTDDNKWHMGKTKKDIQNSSYCSQTSNFAKSIINIGNDTNDFVSKPIGQILEIVPLDNPSNFKVGVPFKVKVLLDEKPAKLIELKGTFEGFGENKFAFLGTTDLKGEIEVTALRGGKWILMTKSKKAYENDNCDEVAYSSTLTFQVK